MKWVLFLLGVSLGACHGPSLRPGESAPGPVQIRHVVATDPPVISWEGGEAAWVEVRHARGRLMWRVVAGGGPRGTDPVRSPLAYGAAGRPAGVQPPDNAGTQSVAGPEPLGPAVRYTVTVDRCVRGGPQVRPCVIRGAFVTSNTIPMGGG